MKKKIPVQLSNLITSNSPRSIIYEIKKIFTYHYPGRNFYKVKKCFKKTNRLFNGKFRGYKACNTQYHNFTHTMDALLAATRLLDGYNIINKKLDPDLARNILFAALLHDTGYIQDEGDNEGTGAKFTLNHVERSIQFLFKHYQEFSISTDDTESISRIIKGTGLSVDMEGVNFISPLERIAGSILGTSDLLGQMSDRIYLEKLLFLYYEFREAGIEGYNTEYDIIQKTVGFYETAKQKFQDDYQGVYAYAQHHFRKRFGIDTNLYMDAVGQNIKYLKQIIADDTTNFRHSLKRGSWVHQM